MGTSALDILSALGDLNATTGTGTKRYGYEPHVSPKGSRTGNTNCLSWITGGVC